MVYTKLDLAKTNGDLLETRDIYMGWPKSEELRHNREK